MSKCDCPPAMGGRFLLSGAGLPKNMYKSRKSVLLELLNIEICAILYNVYPKRKGNLTLLHYDAILFDVDGTLIDSAPGILNTLEEVFSSMGVDVARSDLGRYPPQELRRAFLRPCKNRGGHEALPRELRRQGLPRGRCLPRRGGDAGPSQGCGPDPLHGHLQAHRRCETHPRRAGPCALLLLRGRCVHG